ncbi:lipoprotein [[Acholeplasma] multilocale]|uniref:lipoprotein n=1 Tax=[Acholeplasma] multilocale TaxID=264638 RepID=UPI00047989D4|nr:lipoprotein [[Acholeplasma] multilocale]
MKKLLSILSAVGLVATSGAAVVACSDKKADDEGVLDKTDIGDLLRAAKINGTTINYLAGVQDEEIANKVMMEGSKHIGDMITGQTPTSIGHIMAALGNKVPDYFNDLKISEYWEAGQTQGMIIKGDENDKIGVASDIGKIPAILYTLFETKTKIQVGDEEQMVNILNHEDIEISFELSYIPASVAGVPEEAKLDSVIIIKSINIKATKNSEKLKGEQMIVLG